MRKILLLLPIFMFSLAHAEVDCSKHKIYCKIKSLKPTINNQKAMRLSNIMHKKARKYKGDANLAVAIGMQENSLRQRNRQQNVIQFYDVCDAEGVCRENWRVVRGASDICMFQFHVNTITAYDIDPVKLKNDLDYCVDWHFKLMAIKRKMCRKLEKPWACYHSKTPKLREIYIKFVEEYL